MTETPLGVLVVGAGPTGLALASELRLHGARVRLVEARRDRLDQSRAIGVQPRTLELFDRRGLAAELVSRGDHRPPGADPSTWAGRILGPRLPPPAPPAAAHTEIVDGQLLPLAGGIRVVHTPGHTLGHCAFLLERDGRVLSVGDAAIDLANRIRLPSR